MSRPVALLVSVVLVALLWPAGTGAQPVPDPLPPLPPLEPTDPSEPADPPVDPDPVVDPLLAYRGLATWVDIYDTAVWERPAASVQAMHEQGVRTLFLQTGNYRSKGRIYRPRVVERFIHAAHRRGVQVVAWYLPSFDDLRKDRRRAMAAITFTTSKGQSFDGFALDIEATVVRDLSRRNARMERLSQRLRAAVGPDAVLGAIVPEVDAKYWLDFPYRTVHRYYDVFLPMAYYTYRTKGAAGVDAWIRRNIRAVRTGTGDRSVPIHIIGGLSMHTATGELRAFVDASVQRRVTGASLYEFATTTPRQWRVLQRLR